MATLGEVFRSFCSFGSHDAAKAPSPTMDNAKFAKMCRDCKLLDKKLTATDVDIIFSKIKPRTERKINFKQFQEALKLLAEKKFPGDEGGFEKLKAQIIEAGGPVAKGVTKAVKSSAVDRLTDTSKYTGSHKERFDESGKGKGVEGRKEMVDGSGYVQGFKKEEEKKSEASGDAN
jgi:hypothetical protein